MKRETAEDIDVCHVRVLVAEGEVPGICPGWGSARKKSRSFDIELT